MNRHRLLLLAAMFLAALMATWSAAPVSVRAAPLVHTKPSLQEADATLRIVNESDQTICEVYASLITAADWGDNWLENGESIPEGVTRSITLPPGTYDVLLADCDGNELLDERGITLDGLFELQYTGPDPCTQLIDEAVALHGQARYIEAVEQFQQALDCFRGIGDRAGEGTSLNNIGFIYYSVGQYQQALDYHQRALAIFQEIDNRAGEGRSLNGIGLVYSHLGQYQQALDYFQPALAIQQEIGDRAGEGTSLNNIGLVYGSLGQYQQALEYFQQAVAIQQEIGDRAGEGVSLLNVGFIYDRLGQYQQALDYFQPALAIQQEIGDRAGEGRSLNGIGLNHYNQGQYQQALDYFQQALAIQQEIGDRAGEGRSLNDIGMVYDSLGQYQQALDYYQQALAIRREIGDPDGEGTDLNNIGFIYDSLGQYQQALDYYQQALAIAQEIGDRAGEGTSLSNIAMVYDNLGQYQQALDNNQQALVIAQEIGDRAGEGVSLNNIGYIYLRLGQYQKALDYFQQALAIAQEIGDRAGEGTGLNNIGYIYSRLGQYREALDSYRQAIDVVESIAGEVKVEELKASLAGEHENTYALLIGLLQNQGQSEEAFAYAERARARAFLDQMGNQQVDLRQGAAPELIQQEHELRQRIVGLQNALSAEQAKLLDQQSEELLTQLTDELEKALSKHERLLVQLKLENPEYASLVSVSTLSLEEVQKQVLDADTTLIEYFVLDDRVLVWVVDQEGFELVGLDIGRDDLWGQVDFLRKVISIREFDAGAAANLYDALFAPLRSYIRHPNLVIVPHGVLHYLPFAALWDAEHQRYLVQDYAVTYAPSASALKFILDKLSPDDGRLLAMGNPDGSLPYAEDETEAVASLYGTAPLLRQAAVESQVYAEAGEVDVLHLAAHGEYNSHNALYSSIKLAPDASEDGNLEVHEIYGLDLSGANLVVLSACRTALGEQSEGDELVGLTRAFLYAGTPAVVTTLWSVDDAASGAEMKAFYGHVRDGMTNAEALRAAQLAVMADERWSDPYFWAAFSLTGDYRGNGEPRMAGETAPERAATAEATPTVSASSTEAAVPTPVPAPARGGPCGGSAALPIGLVLFVGVQRLRKRERTKP